MQTRLIPMRELAQILSLQLEKGGQAKLTVTGCSMVPMLYGYRDWVMLVPADAPCKRGDVILYQRENGQYVLHRIIALSGQDYICSGDNQAMREPVSREQVMAVVESFCRKGKRYTGKAVSYRIYKWIWVNLFCFRKPYIFVRRKLGQIRKKLRSWKKKRNEI